MLTASSPPNRGRPVHAPLSLQVRAVREAFRVELCGHLLPGGKLHEHEARNGPESQPRSLAGFCFCVVLLSESGRILLFSSWNMLGDYIAFVGTLYSSLMLIPTPHSFLTRLTLSDSSTQDPAFCGILQVNGTE